MEQGTSHTDNDGFTARKSGLLSHFQFEDGSGQFAFMHIDNNGRVGIDHSLSFCTEKYVNISAICNGSLLLSSIKDDSVCYYVYDPITNNCASLPQPCITTRIIGKGIAVEGDRYEVVLLHIPGVEDNAKELHDSNLEMEIFSSGSGSWRRHRPRDFCFPSPLLTSEFPELDILPLYSNGSIHWELSGYLLVYQVEAGTCELIELPNVFSDWSWQFTMTYRRCLWESEGHVNYTYTDFEGIHTWELLKEEDRNLFTWQYDHEKFRWQLTHSIMHDDMIWKNPEILHWLGENSDRSIQWEPCHTSPVAYTEDFGSMYLQLPGVVVSYDLRNCNLEKVCTYRVSGVDFYCCSFFPFTYDYQCKSRVASDPTAPSEAAITLPVEDRMLNTLPM